MRILFVTEDLPARHLGGAGKHAVLLANTLIQAGHYVEFLGRNDVPGDERNNEFLGTFHRGFSFARTGWKEATLGAFNPLRRRHMASRIRAAIFRLSGPWDVIHYHGHFPELGASLPADINFVQTLHDQGSECLRHVRFRDGAPCPARAPRACAVCATPAPNGLQTALSGLAVEARRGAARIAYTRHRAIFVSAFVERRCLEILSPSTVMNTHVVHNFIDAQQLAAVAATVDEKDVVGRERLRIIMAGRLDETKGFSALLAALSDTALRSREIRVGGVGPDLLSVRERHEKRGVAFLGWLSYPDVVTEIVNADAVVVPSIWEEPCGTAILEALALGRMVFALRRGGTPELARYAAAPEQLRLFDTLEELAQSLAALNRPLPRWPLTISADVHARLPEILAVYAARRAMQATS